MSEAKLPKYRTVVTENAGELQEKMNALAELGYTFKQVVISDRDETPFLIAVMTIQEGDYTGVKQLRDIAPELVTDALSSGWEIASASISTKFCRMVHR